MFLLISKVQYFLHQSFQLKADNALKHLSSFQNHKQDYYHSFVERLPLLTKKEIASIEIMLYHRYSYHLDPMILNSYHD